MKAGGVWEGTVQALCGKGPRQRWPCLFGKEWERREGKAFISRDLALPLAPGTFLSTESWEGWRSRNGIWGTLGEVGVLSQRLADADKPKPRMPSAGSWRHSRARPHS